MPGINLDSIVEKAIRNVYERKVQAGGLDADVWADNVRTLWKGASQGLGIKTGYQNSTHYELAAALRQNLFVFGAFKNHHQVNDLVQLLTDPAGNLRSFAEFKDQALQVSQAYNASWLQAEYNTAVASAQAAVRWNDFQSRKKALPFIRYVTAKDGRVREAHARLHGVVRHIDDAFWDVWFPPNGWNCRCDVEQTAGGETPAPDVLPDDKQTPPTFRNNPGKSGQVFTMQHPYFQLINPEQRGNVMKAAAKLIFDNYNPAQYVKDSSPEAVQAFRTLTQYASTIGYDRAGGFLVIHRGHTAAALADELPVLNILRNRGGMLELLDERNTKIKYDLFWDGNFWDIKRMRSSTRPDRTIRDYFRDAKAKGKSKLLIHIDQDISDDKLREHLYHALRQSPEISLVQMVWNGGRMLRLTAEQIRDRAAWRT